MCRWQPCLDTVPAKLTISNRSSRDTVSFDPRLPSAFASRRDTFDSDPTHFELVLEYLRYGELQGRPFEPPPDFYPGEYVIDVARTLVDDFGDQYLDAPESEWIDRFRERGLELMVERIRSGIEQDLADWRVG